MFWLPIALLIGGLFATAAVPLWLPILGITLVTIGFFGAHAIASAWVGRPARGNRGQAAVLYLFVYYPGLSVLGSAGGIARSHATLGGGVAFLSIPTASEGYHGSLEKPP